MEVCIINPIEEPYHNKGYRRAIRNVTERCTGYSKRDNSIGMISDSHRRGCSAIRNGHETANAAYRRNRYLLDRNDLHAPLIWDIILWDVMNSEPMPEMSGWIYIYQ